MSPAAAVEIGPPPVEKVSPFFNPSSSDSAFFPESDQRSMDPSSSFHFGFEAGSGQKTKSRQKPRLVKVRKNGRKVKGASFSGESPPGFNPFAPPPSRDAESGKTGREACPEPCREPDIAQNGDGETRDDDSEANLFAEMNKLNINEEAREYSNAPPAFIFGSSGKGDAAAASGPCSFSSNGFRQSDNAADDQIPAFHPGTTNINNFTSTTFGTETSCDGFKVPLCDPSSLKSSLFPEIGRTPVHVRSKRSSKDQRSNKVKGKKKQHEPNRCNDQTSKGNDPQEKLSSPGYSSPMDFSPYEGDKSSNQFPTETPLTSLDHPPVFTAEDCGRSIRMPQFSFSASTPQGETSTKKLHAVKKYRRKVNNLFPKKNLNTTMRNNQENQAKQEPASASVMPGECEVWRLRGNQAYRNGDMCKAEECYTHGINSSSSSDGSECYVKPLALCYGNRAAARISLGRLREAISDCDMAASLDPTYIKAYMRAANCYLVLGELGSAVQYFNKCMESASSICLDRRTTIESAEGLQQAQRVADYTNSASIFLEKRTPDGASDALVPITNALSISSCSEKLLQMKAEAMLMIRRYKEVIELCENTLQTADRNFVSAGPDGIGSKHHSLIVWRWNMVSKSHFYLGNLEIALDTLEKLQQMGSSCNENQEECRDSPASLVATISELLRYKNAGNEAVRAGKYTEAAVSRRATLHEMIRDYDQAASDLKRLISILVKQNGEKAKTSETSSADRSSTRKELKQARQRLSVMEEKSKEGIALDFFLIMGVKVSDTAADIKKAYRKAALRHHPDKAAQILVRSESEGPWLKEILEEVHKGADRLFKMIGEAYSVLSDQTKVCFLSARQQLTRNINILRLSGFVFQQRSDYELEEEIRKAKASRESYRSRKAAEASTTSPYQTSPVRRYWRHSERTYRSSSPWW
ncbi:hypothetical protein DY000_02028472 [Brassica cretica]|uniref:J domain-containing protein n=1 Tax=Brassica cretica TaxID=69181 RepID=A0ABQ7DX77_BRACR|nr:hypothetical protein DY000_02028472 [Brassica cretica]